MPQRSKKISGSDVGFVGGDFRHAKAAFGCLINERLEVGVVISMLLTHFYTRYYIRLHSAHQMDLDPRMLLYFSTIFHVKPSRELPRSKARTINRKVSFNTLERHAAIGDELLQVGSQQLVLKIAGNTVVVRKFGQVTLDVLLSSHWRNACQRGLYTS